MDPTSTSVQPASHLGPARSLAVLASLAAAPLLSACGGGSDDIRVLVVGDSITNLTADNLFERHDDIRQLTVRATNGATSADMLEAVEPEVDPDRYDQVILNLGTNDVGADMVAGETIGYLESFVALFTDARCIHVTTVNEHLISFDRPELPDRVAELNDHIREMVDGDDRLHLIDWSGAVGDYLDVGEPDGPLLSDTVHPTEVGQDLLHRLYLRALDRCDGAGAPPGPDPEDDRS